MAIASYSEALAQYLANVDYVRANSVAKCDLFIESINAMLAFPSSTSKGDERAEFDRKELAKALEAAQLWRNVNAPTLANGGRRSPRVAHVDVSGWRD